MPFAAQVEEIVMSTPVHDIHTHLYDPAFGGLLLWGIDELLVYHYLVAEAFRHHRLPYEKFWALAKMEQADLIWQELFLEHSPMSEACRGVLTTLHELGLDVKKRDLAAIRKWFAGQTVEDHDAMPGTGGGENICMTNWPFDDAERRVWEKGFRRDERFTAALRIDPLLLAWTEDGAEAGAMGLRSEAGEPSSEKTLSEMRRFLADWSKRMDARYVMVSLPPDFEYPARRAATRLIEQRCCRIAGNSGCRSRDAGSEAGGEPAIETGGRRRGNERFGNLAASLRGKPGEQVSGDGAGAGEPA